MNIIQIRLLIEQGHNDNELMSLLSANHCENRLFLLLSLYDFNNVIQWQTNICSLIILMN